MNAALEAALREQLRHKGERHFTIENIHEMTDRLQNTQPPLSPREWLRFLYTVRLEGALKRRPERAEIHSKIRSILAAVEATAEDEPIFSWRVATPTRELSGISAVSRLIVYGPDIVSNQQSA